MGSDQPLCRHGTSGYKQSMRSVRLSIALLPWLALAGCNPNGADAGVPGGDDTQPFSALPADETLFFTGTEPFWGGEVQGETLLYRTPEDQQGQTIEVTRFAGRGGLSFSGTLGATRFDMALRRGDCSDGMSDRIYPLTVTLSIGEELRHGCGWTEAQPFRE